MNISGTNFTGEGLSAIRGELSNLENIECRHCENLTDEGLKEVLRLTRNSLKTLDIEGTNITGEGLAGFNITLPTLECLDIRYCNNITVVGYSQLRRICGDKLVLSQEQEAEFN